MESRVLVGDVMAQIANIPDQSVQTVVTSPPYWGLRDYGHDDQLGSEHTPEEYVSNMVAVFRQVWRVLRDDGTVWLNLGDSYNGSGGAGGDYNAGGLKDGQPKYNGRNVGTLKPKDLCGIPWRVAFALQADGWYLRQDIIWHKPNPMPESVTDRCTKAHEYIFLLSKSPRYYYDYEAIKEAAKYEGDERHLRSDTSKLLGNCRSDGGSSSIPGSATAGRNKRSVWTVTTKPYAGAHFAVFPPDLIEPCILAGTSAKGQCPQCGAPWVREVSKTFVPQDDIRDPNKLAKASNKGLDDSNGWGDTPRGTNHTHTIGWSPSCDCDAGDSVPQTVLDPFAGSGTTLQVAIENGRNAVGIELNPEYAELIRQRLVSTQPMLTGMAL